MDQSRPLADFTKAIAGCLRATLTRSGLYPKEARAMVNTWTNSYFRSEGTRVLFVLPQSWTDSFIPMTIDPEPRELVRVMVGRVELLTPEREQSAEAAVRELAHHDPVKRGQAFRFLHEQGRYVEPIVRRVMKTTTDDGVRTLCRRLLLTELVTDLRAAVCNADDGRWINVHPQLLHGHLARMLREVGLDAEARAEGTPCWRSSSPASAGASKAPAETSHPGRSPGGGARGRRRRPRRGRDLRPPRGAPGPVHDRRNAGGVDRLAARLVGRPRLRSLPGASRRG